MTFDLGTRGGHDVVIYVQPSLRVLHVAMNHKSWNHLTGGWWTTLPPPPSPKRPPCRVYSDSHL